ncbi:hypothetical protein B0H66DRAFT_569856 [Apodospora peruviana]|uniref:Uncharacterized protein n=1 Tax=Apodospora peruviana TaxID=516989 RepID=A0AAE0LZA1_9PEZI|nr:hypothetical protein B0H66DRAFT_569856 [Apodospora peruviana]
MAESEIMENFNLTLANHRNDNREFVPGKRKPDDWQENDRLGKKRKKQKTSEDTGGGSGLNHGDLLLLADRALLAVQTAARVITPGGPQGENQENQAEEQDEEQDSQPEDKNTSPAPGPEPEPPVVFQLRFGEPPYGRLTVARALQAEFDPLYDEGLGRSVNVPSWYTEGNAELMRRPYWASHPPRSGVGEEYKRRRRELYKESRQGK